jgi:ribose-phosphate pyrophosphokinase
MNHAPVIFALPEDWRFAERLAACAGVELGSLTTRAFPDGETYMRLNSAVAGRQVAIVCSLHQPNERILPLIFLADTARSLEAERVGLVAPYLAYMRQDTRFNSGEAITSRSFARLVSGAHDWLITVDPHLHRIHRLGDVYTVPSLALHAAADLGRWIARSVENPVVVGPDEESAQWASAVADAAGAPWTALSKVRHGDRAVDVRIPDFEPFLGHTPVLVDDIISSGQTMVDVIRQLRQAGAPPPVCVAVHAVLGQHADEALIAAGASIVVTTNTIPHPTNGIDIVPMLASAVRERLYDR